MPDSMIRESFAEGKTEVLLPQDFKNQRGRGFLPMAELLLKNAAEESGVLKDRRAALWLAHSSVHDSLIFLAYLHNDKSILIDFIQAIDSRMNQKSVDLKSTFLALEEGFLEYITLFKQDNKGFNPADSFRHIMSYWDPVIHQAETEQLFLCMKAASSANDNARLLWTDVANEIGPVGAKIAGAWHWIGNLGKRAAAVCLIL